jgi:hypothetical protein
MFAYNTIIPIPSLTKEEQKQVACCTLCGKPKGTGKMYKCRGCRLATYCCRAHQRTHWTAHKTSCKDMQEQWQAAKSDMKRGLNIMKNFARAIRLYVKDGIPSQELGRVFRATKCGTNFHIHGLSEKDYATTKNALMPSEEVNEQRSGGLTFVIFSTETTAHGITFVKASRVL